MHAVLPFESGAPRACGSWLSGQSYETRNLKTIVQNIVNRPGWSSGNSRAFVRTGTSGVRSAWPQDGSAASAPSLRVEIEGAAGDGPTGPLVTVRSRLLHVFDEIEYKSGKPIVDALYEGVLYYLG